MDRFRYEALSKEFPWLRRIIELIRPAGVQPVELDDIRIRRIDKRFFDRILLDDTWGDSIQGPLMHEEELWAVFSNTHVRRVPIQRVSRYVPTYLGARTTEAARGQRILESLVGFEDALFFAITERSSAPRTVRMIEIYKPSRDTTIAREMQKAREVAEAQVRAEANF
jgi:hypothetical protein